MSLTNSELKKRLTDTIGLLCIPGIGRARFHRLIKACGSPAAVLAAPVSRLAAIPGISRSLAKDVQEHLDREGAAQTASRIVQLGWTVLFPDCPGFPRPLLNIDDRPPLLFCVGEPPGEPDTMIGIVGTRRPTSSGRRFAAGLAAALAKAGITVVSGLAEGIDAAAHQGALQAGGRTVAVLGNSLDFVYPGSNRKLSADIRDHGALYSEYLPGTRPDPAHFPQRNRLISGLSEGIVVVEAGQRSGALITAAHALEQGRELFAVPGRPGDKMSVGTNSLIKQGARLLTGVDDIFDELPRLKGDLAVKQVMRMPDLTAVEKDIVDLCSPEPRQIDLIARSLKMPTAEVMEYLLALELKGVLSELSGKRFIVSEELL